MKIRTDCGIEIFCLPDCAMCIISSKHPDDMQTCPLFMFDPQGMECIPEACEFYEEDWKKNIDESSSIQEWEQEHPERGEE